MRSIDRRRIDDAIRGLAPLSNTAASILEQLEAQNEVGVLLLGRPYHLDPGLNHNVLDEFQALMEQLYGAVDRERGIPSTVAWIAEEVGELAQAVRKGTREQQLHELGDVLAWVASLANQLDLSLTEAVQRYVDDPPR